MKREPCEECAYNHVVAKTPIGDIHITWKGWKEYPSYDAELPWLNGWAYENTLDGAKNRVQDMWNVTVLEMMELSTFTNIET